MAHELSDNAQDIISEIRDIIKNNATKGQEKPGKGWEYSGLEISIDKLEKELKESGGFKVLECHVLHVVEGGTILNPKHNLLLIPVNGTPRFSSGEQVQPCHHIQEEIKIHGGNIDIIVVALQEM